MVLALFLQNIMWPCGSICFHVGKRVKLKRTLLVRAGVSFTPCFGQNATVNVYSVPIQ